MAGVAAFGAAMVAVVPSAWAAPIGDIALASTSDSAVKGNGHASLASLSSDGRVVAFSSVATNLDPADTDTIQDAYVKDLATGDLVLASTSDTGVKGNSISYGVSLSADGGLVAFVSRASNLDPADHDSNLDVYVKNLATGDIVLASTSDAGVKSNGSGFSPPSLSPDGTAVSFESSGTNLDPADTDTVVDVYVKDLTSGDVVLASTSDAEFKGNGDSYATSLSDDGNRVAFISLAGNLDPSDADNKLDVYVKDLATGDIVLASASDAGVDSDRDNYEPSIAGDGSAVAFRSQATNLDPADPDLLLDIYVKQLASGNIVLVSTSQAGVKSNGNSGYPSLSIDGASVAYDSTATNLHPADTDTTSDIYLKQVASGGLVVASTSDSGVKADRSAQAPTVSASGGIVAFQSTATNLDPIDTDTLSDIYVKTLIDPLPPTANDDAYTTDEDAELTVPAPGVLANDTGEGGLSAVLGEGPTHGELVLEPDGSFTYTPDQDFNGTDEFTYTASDGEQSSAPALVIITVTPGNDAPTAVDDAYSTGEDSPLTVSAPGVLANDSDVDGDVLTAVLGDEPMNGELSLAPDGSFSYTPDAGFDGTDSFTYSASDGALSSAAATVTITVNAAPPLVSVTNRTKLEGDAGQRRFRFKVLLWEASTALVTIDFATVPGSAVAGSDYTSRSGTLSFAPGETSKTVVIRVFGDNEVELTERFLVELSNPSNAAIADGRGVGKIRNDDF